MPTYIVSREMAVIWNSPAYGVPIVYKGGVLYEKSDSIGTIQGILQSGFLAGAGGGVRDRRRSLFPAGAAEYIPYI